MKPNKIKGEKKILYTIDGLESWHDFATSSSGAICPICGKTFRVKNGLVTHMRLHRSGVIGVDGKATREHLAKTKAGRISAEVSKETKDVAAGRWDHKFAECKTPDGEICEMCFKTWVKWHIHKCFKCGRIFTTRCATDTDLATCNKCFKKLLKIKSAKEYYKFIK